MVKGPLRVIDQIGDLHPAVATAVAAVHIVKTDHSRHQSEGCAESQAVADTGIEAVMKFLARKPTGLPVGGTASNLPFSFR